MTKTTLKAEAVAAVQRIRERGALFVEETKAAGTSLFTETKEAGERFVGTARDASEQLVSALREETEAFVRLAREMAAMPRLPAPAEVRELAETEARERTFELQKDLLVRLKKTLTQVEAKVDERLTGLETPKAKKAKPAKKASKPKVAKAAKSPLAGYDALNAKEVLAKLADADPATAAAIVAYEKAHKNRKTIVEAAEKAAA